MKRIVEKQCPICGKVTYMVIDAENYDQVMEYMVALYFNTKRKVVQKALPFLDKFGREFIKSGYCPECQEDLFNSVLEDKSSYFSCSDIDNEVLDEFFEVVYKIGAVNALSSDKANALSMHQKLYIANAFEVWERLQVDDSGKIILVSEVSEDEKVKS